MVADLPECPDGDFLCKSALSLLKRNMWSSYVRNNIVQAQYYRVPIKTLEKPLTVGSRGFGAILGIIGLVG